MHHLILSTGLALVSLITVPPSVAALRAPQDPAQESIEAKVAEILAEDWEAKIVLESDVDGAFLVAKRYAARLQELQDYIRTVPNHDSGDLKRAIGLLEAQVEKLQSRTAIDKRGAKRVKTDMDAVVESALGRGDGSLINRLGPSITHILEAILLEADQPADVAQYAASPYQFLLHADWQRGLEVAQVLLERPEKGWVAIVADSFSDYDWVDANLTADELLASPAYEVSVRLAGSPEVEEETRYSLIAGFLHQGVRSEALASLARTMWRAAIRDSALAEEPTSWLTERWLQDENPLVRAGVAKAILKKRKDVETLEGLIANSDPTVRAMAASELDELIVQNILPSERVLALWETVRTDPSPKVRKAAYSMLRLTYRSGVRFELSAELYAELVHQLEDPVEQTLAGDLVALMDEPRGSGRKGADYGTMMAALVQSSLVDSNPNLLDVLNEVSGDEVVFAAFLDAVDWSQVSDGRLDKLRGYAGELGDLSTDEKVSRFASWVTRPAFPGVFLGGLFGENVRPVRISKGVLKPEEAVALILNERAFKGHLAGQFLIGTDWTPMTAELQGAMQNASLSVRQRLIARLALYHSAGPEVVPVATIADDLVALGKTASGLQDAHGLASTLNRLRPEPSAERLALFAELVANPGVPTEALDAFWGVGLNSEELSVPQVASIIDNLHARHANDRKRGTGVFRGLAWECLQCMQANPEMFRKSLVLEWMSDTTRVPDCSLAAVAAGRRDMLPAIREVVFRELDQTESLRSINRLLSALSVAPGPDLTRALLDFANRTKSAQARLSTMERIRMSIEIAELGSRLDGASAGPTRESALRELVVMLDDPQEIVRVEAIRSLATMGAVEHLPRLIGFLTSESEAEQAAARIALDTLHNQGPAETKD